MGTSPTLAKQPALPERKPPALVPARAPVATATPVQLLQRRLGNRGTAAFVARSALQVSSPHDPAEREGHQPVAHGVSREIRASTSGGSPPPSGVWPLAEPRSGADFSAARIHGGERTSRATAKVGAAARHPGGSAKGTAAGAMPFGAQATPEMMPPSVDWRKSRVEVPYTHSEGSRALAAAIGQAAQDARGKLYDTVTSGVEGVHKEVERQRNLVFDTGARQAEHIHAEFNKARSDVDHAISAAHTGLDAVAQAQQGLIAGWHAGAIAQASRIFTGGGLHALEVGKKYGDGAVQAADNAASSVAGPLEAKVAEARRIGEGHAATGSSKPEVIEAMATAARDLASDTEQKIRDAVDDFLPKFREDGPRIAESFMGQAGIASVQIQAGLPSVLGQIGTFYQQITASVTQAVSQTAQALSSTGAVVNASLTDSQHMATAQLHQQVNRQAMTLTKVGRQGAASLDKEGHKAADAGDAHLNSLNRHLADINLSASRASDVSTSISASLDKAYQPLLNQVNTVSFGVEDQIAQTGGTIARALNTTGPTIGVRLGGMVGQTRDTVDMQTTSVSSSLLTGVVTATTTATTTLTDIGTGVDQEMQKFEGAFAKGLGDYRSDLDKKASSAVDDVREPVDTLPDRIATAQQRIEDRANKSWLENQWDDFVDMISSPGFWAGLLAGIALIALAIFLLPEELGLLAIVAIGAAIGGIAAGIGTIVGNLWNGRSWDENLLRNIAIGLGAGAIFALAGAGLAALGFGVGSLGFIAGMSLTAGAVTIVSNLITGRPWDEGLLANMAFAGILARLGKLGKPQGEPPSAPAKPPIVPPEPVPPGPVPPEPVPPGPVPPEPVPPGPVPPEPVPPEPVPVVPKPGSKAEVDAWKRPFRTRPAVGKEGAAARQYQVDQCGPTETEVQGGGERIFADGVNSDRAVLQDAKLVSKPDQSPFVDDSKIDPKIRRIITAQTEAEVDRYGAVINDPATPVVGLEIITNEPRAVPFFERLLAKFGVPGKVVVKK